MKSLDVPCDAPALSRKPRWVFQSLAGLAVAGIFSWAAFRNADVAALLGALEDPDYRYLAPILLVLAALYWLRALRWSWLLRPLCWLSAREAAPALLIGAAGNNVLPAHLGEVLRAVVLAREFGLSKTAVLSTLVLERLLDLLSVLGILAVTLRFLPKAPQLEILRAAGCLLGAFVVGFLSLLGVFVWRSRAALRAAEKLFSVFGPGVRRKLLEHMRLAAEGLKTLRSPKLLAGVVGITLLAWILNGAGLYLATLSVSAEVPVPPLAALVLTSVVVLGLALPTAPGYVGTMQWCFVLALGVFAVPRETALAASIYALVVGFVPVTVAGVWFFLRLEVSRRRDPL